MRDPERADDGIDYEFLITLADLWHEVAPMCHHDPGRRVIEDFRDLCIKRLRARSALG